MVNLKKLSFSFFIMLFFSTVMLAQLELKPSLGLNFTSFSKDPVNGSTSAQVGWQIGATISMGDKTYGEGGIFWVHKSNKVTEETTNYDFDTELSGIRIPLMVGYHLLGSEGGIIGLRGFAGASVFLLNSVDVRGLSSSDFESANYGVFLGVGVNITMFFVDFKYEWSLSDVSKISAFDVGKTKSLFINGGIRLSL